jgi:hypothetical protein
MADAPPPEAAAGSIEDTMLDPAAAEEARLKKRIRDAFDLFDDAANGTVPSE